MVNKGDPADGHPGYILSQVCNAQKTGFFIFFKDPAEKDVKDAGDSRPPDNRISHAAYGTYLGGVNGVVGVKKRHPAYGPFIKGGTIVMFRHQIRMVIEHVNRSLNHFVCQVFVGGIAHYRDKTDGIDK